MATKFHRPTGGPLRKLLEYYTLGCIGHLAADREAVLLSRVQRTYGGGPDWKATLRRVLTLDDASEEILRQQWQTEQARAQQAGLTVAPEDFATRAVEETFGHLVKPKPVAVPHYRMTGPIALKAIGFWRDDQGIFRTFPRPQWFVQPGWHAGELVQIISYLRSGYNFAHCSGWSTCRFGCAEGERNGTGNFTDGQWMWPEGLAHYVERHEVMLPEEFVQTMQANGWTVPDVADLVPPGMWHFDHAFWLEWVTKHRRGW